MRAREDKRIEIVPVVHEELVLGKIERETDRVRVTTHVDEVRRELDVPTRREDVDVERVPIGRVVEAAPRTRVEGATTIIPVVEEVLVVEKRLFLREEVRVTKRVVNETKHVSHPLRKERVEVEASSTRRRK